MKKVWQGPIVERLGLENTNDEPSNYIIGDNTQPPVGWNRVRCDVCNKIFSTANAYNEHKSNGDGNCDYTTSGSGSQDHVTYLYS